MDVRKGTIVKSLAGRDKNGLFLVTEADDDYAYIADGRVRRLESPKRKNAKHLAPLNGAADVLGILSNKQLRKLLRELSSEADVNIKR